MLHHQTNRRMVTVAMLIAILLVAIDVTVVGTAMPRIVSDLGGLSQFSWVFAIYTLTTSVTTPIYGKLADLFGRKVVFTVGVTLFVLGSMLSGISQTMNQLIWFRAFQGLGAGAVMPLTFTIIGDLFPGEQRARMQGLFSSVWGVAGLIGPLLGGFFVDHVSWRWIFYINLPVGIVSLVLLWSSLHETFERKQRRRIDYWGAFLFTVSMSSLLYALLNAGVKYAWSSVTILFLFAVAAVTLTLFLVVESRSREPMLPLSLFRIRVIATSNAASFFASCVLIATTVYLPMWIQGIIGFSATSSGLTLLPMSLAWPLGATVAGRIMYRAGSKLTAVLGMVLIVAGGLWLASIGLSSPDWFFVVVMMLIGAGMGLSMTPFTVLIQGAVSWNQRGAATASSTFMRSIGQTVGVAIYGTWFNHTMSSYFHAHSQGAVGAAGGAHADAFSDLLNVNKGLHLPPSVIELMRQGLGHGLHIVFLAVAGTAVVSLMITLLMPTHRHVMQQQAEVSAH